MMEWAGIRTLVDLGQWIVTAIVAVLLWLTRRHAATQSAIQAAEQRAQERTAQVERRVDVTEERLTHMPTHTDMAALHERVNAVSEGMGVINGQLVRVTNSLDRIQDYLMRRSDGGDT